MAINNIVLVGNGSFQQTAPARYITNAWELDRLIVPFRGFELQRENFISGLEDWQSSELDPDMFLSEITNDDNKIWPTVTQTYLGKRGGVLPPNRRIQQRSIQQVRYISYSKPGDPATGYAQQPAGTDPRFIGTFTLDVTYAALTKGLIVWARDDSELDVGDIGDSIGFPGEVYIDRVVGIWENWHAAYFDFSVYQGVTLVDIDPYGLFFLDTVISGDIEEVVPDQYFKANSMVNSLLFPDPPFRPST